MDREEGMDVLSRGAWLKDTPADFRDAILSRCRWQRLEPGDSLQSGGQGDGEISGLADGILEMRSVIGRADTPIMHYARPVYWVGLTRILSRSRRHGRHPPCFLPVSRQSVSFQSRPGVSLPMRRVHDAAIL
jgi:CRP/FNR family transcriptional regulator, cyclic AMP receptor protein